MGFISFNEAFYHEKLKSFEGRDLTEADLYEVRQLLKVLDDLTDEGYTNLNDRMERDFSCLSRLRALLVKAGTEPFPMLHEERIAAPYGSSEFELAKLLDRLMTEAREASHPSDAPFLRDIYDYCQWIGYEPDTAYVFLMRDTLLPCVFFKSRYGKSVYPWLINRKFLEDITGIVNVDDDIRLPIYEALESGHARFEDCCSFCGERILRVLEQYPNLNELLRGLLGSLKEKKIVVIESGYMGTIPMMLKALDDRVTFRLYTTAPFLYETYGDLIYCRRYEDVRKFETIYSQDLLLEYSSYHNGQFYVNVCENDKVRGCSLAEIKKFTV